MKKFLFFISCLALAALPFAAHGMDMRVKQPFYGTEFDVYRTPDMPANWFRTYDGYYVTRRLDNWVYGRMTPEGLKFTDIIVGSVDPRTVQGLGSNSQAGGLVSDGLVQGSQWEAPVYMPPEPPQEARADTLLGREKAKNPEYLKELKEIIKGLRVTQDDFKKVHLYSYPYLTRRHFKTRVPLDFYIVHQRETGHVEFFVNVAVRAYSAPKSILFNFDGYDGEVYELVPLEVESEGGFAERRSGVQERSEFWENVYYLFNKPLFRRHWPTLRGYGLRLATNASSTTLPSPVYTTLMQKISSAGSVEIRLGDSGDFIRSGSDTRYKLRGWPDLVWIFQTDEKKRFVESMKARYETYRKLVDLEKRWQPSEEPQIQSASWLPDQPLSAALIYDIMEAGDFESLVAGLKHLFGEPRVQEFPRSGDSRTNAQLLWDVGEHIRIGLEYRFEGGTWRRNKWEWVSSFVTEKWNSPQSAFNMRKDEFTKMLGAAPMPPYKDPLEAVWSIWDGSRFTLRLAGNSLFYTSQKKKLDHTVVELVR